MHYKRGTGWVETNGRKVCSLREGELMQARVYRRTGDTAAFTRLLIERKATSHAALMRAFNGTERSHAEATARISGVLTVAAAFGQTVKLT